MKSRYPMVLASALALIGHAAFSAGVDSPSVESPSAYQEALVAYAERIRQLPQAEYRNRLEEWSRGLGLALPIEPFERQRQIRQAAAPQRT